MGVKLRAAVYKTHLQVLHLKLRKSNCERVKHVHQHRRTLSLTRLYAGAALLTTAGTSEHLSRVKHLWLFL